MTLLHCRVQWVHPAHVHEYLRHQFYATGKLRNLVNGLPMSTKKISQILRCKFTDTYFCFNNNLKQRMTNSLTIYIYAKLCHWHYRTMHEPSKPRISFRSQQRNTHGGSIDHACTIKGDNSHNKSSTNTMKLIKLFIIVASAFNVSFVQFKCQHST